MRTPFTERIFGLHTHLRDAAIVHAFGGAIALAYHVASPRATADIDINITADPTTARQVLTALPSGVRWTDSDVAQVERDGQTRLLWERTPVDLFFPQHELHTVVAERVVTVPLADFSIPVISATDLTIFKALFDRGQDWIDIEHMWAYGKVDRADARAWLVRLMGADDQRITRLDHLPNH